MTKAEIVSKISEKTGIEKTTTLAVVESLMAEIKDSIKNEESVFLRGFGTFLAKERKEKTAISCPIIINSRNIYLVLI
jgi:DNA-binding protein HU-beta